MHDLLTDDCRREQLQAVGLAGLVRVEPLVFNPNNAATVTVEHLALDDGSSVIRKVLARDAEARVSHWAAGAHPGHWNYWRREIDAYESGAVDAFGPFVVAPGVVGRYSPDPGIEVLFLDHVEGLSGEELDIEVLAAAARALGRAQGTTGSTAERPDMVSASREWIWAYATSRPSGAVGYANSHLWNHPVVIEGFGDAREELRTRYAELLADIPRWRRVLSACPQTFCHLDFWSRNLIMTSLPGAGHRPGQSSSQGQNFTPLLVDWSFAGIGAVGEDPGNLVPDVMVDHQFHPDHYDRFDSAVWSAYSTGLSESAWPHDPDWARLAMCIAVLKFVWLPAAMVAAADYAGPTAYGGEAGPPLVEVFARRAAVLRSMLERVDEARVLARRLGAWRPTPAN